MLVLLEEEGPAVVLTPEMCAGLLPFYMVGTIGTTSSCAVDPIGEMGLMAQKFKLW